MVQQGNLDSPSVDKSFDVEPKGRAHGHDILAVDLLQDGRLSGIVKASFTSQLDEQTKLRSNNSQEENAHLTLLYAIFADDCEEAHISKMSVLVRDSTRFLSSLPSTRRTPFVCPLCFPEAKARILRWNIQLLNVTYCRL